MEGSTYPKGIQNSFILFMVPLFVLALEFSIWLVGFGLVRC